MSGWLVGVDAGGTRTRAAALDRQTGTLRRAEGAGANWTVHGPEVCRERIGAVLAEALPEGAVPEALCLGIAGYYPPDHRAGMEAWLAETWPGVAARAVPDVTVAWAGAHGGEAGLVIIAGTGSICYGRGEDGREARAGGLGPLFSDQGSAYWVGLQCLRALADMVDGIGAETTLADRLRTRYPHPGRENEDLVGWLRGLYRHGWDRERIAALAADVSEEAWRDGIAGAILERAGQELAQMAWAVQRRLGPGPRPLALQGGLASGAALLRTMVGGALERSGSLLYLSESRFSPLEGALLLAAETAGGAEGRRVLRKRLEG